MVEEKQRRNEDIPSSLRAATYRSVQAKTVAAKRQANSIHPPGYCADQIEIHNTLCNTERATVSIAGEYLTVVESSKRESRGSLVYLNRREVSS